MGFRERMFGRDLAAMIALEDARKAENAKVRARCMANKELCEILLAAAKRRGCAEIDWSEYFRNIGFAD